MDPFLPDLDPELEPEPEDEHHVNNAMAEGGYEVGSPSSQPASIEKHSDGDDGSEGMATSALFPGSDIF